MGMGVTGFQPPFQGWPRMPRSQKGPRPWRAGSSCQPLGLEASGVVEAPGPRSTSCPPWTDTQRRPTTLTTLTVANPSRRLVLSLIVLSCFFCYKLTKVDQS